MPTYTRLILIVALLVLYSCKPEKSYLVDAAGLLSHEQENNLRLSLLNISQTGRYSLYIHTVTGGDTTENFIHREGLLAEIPNKGKPDAIMIYVASSNRKIHIRTGESIMYTLTDSLCLYTISRIIPYFKKKEYYFGLKEGVYVIDSIINNDVYRK